MSVVQTLFLHIANVFCTGNYGRPEGRDDSLLIERSYDRRMSEHSVGHCLVLGSRMIQSMETSSQCRKHTISALGPFFHFIVVLNVCACMGIGLGGMYNWDQAFKYVGD